ncbi:hypothetical protein [Streptomyces sp. NRRL S-340]|uniref:hypothetical protein n=1 Tax=Streptomyces sp. NRRL S-340 TaxID=1463901 RepID=UPI000561D868|nr:hypothetical protein [Streptomyces sp. NRRL S-340]
MRRSPRRHVTTALASAAAAALLGLAPGTASATSGPTILDRADDRCATVGSGNVCLYDNQWFSGKVALYQDVDSQCVTTPFGVLADYNMTNGPVSYYKNADCTGDSVTEPAGDFHSWLTFGPTHSFRAR